MKNIIQGGKSIINVVLVDQLTKSFYDLTGAQDVTVCFQNDDGSDLTLNLASGVQITSAANGKIQITLTAAQTALLRVIPVGTLEVAVKFTSDPANPIKVQIPEAYQVVQTQC